MKRIALPSNARQLARRIWIEHNLLIWRYAVLPTSNRQRARALATAIDDFSKLYTVCPRAHRFLRLDLVTSAISKNIGLIALSRMK